MCVDDLYIYNIKNKMSKRYQQKANSIYAEFINFAVLVY